ncbi:hypothetical protein G6F42_015721 [Rhizopus arrhizus]|nr:hypothetical protein G6F42_015721 [Rhizopus arrhizus]
MRLFAISQPRCVYSRGIESKRHYPQLFFLWRMCDESQTMDGTSMANPHVTGIAAMLMSEYEFHSASELYEAIMNIATENVLTSSIEDDGSERLLAYNGPERF